MLLPSAFPKYNVAYRCTFHQSSCNGWTVMNCPTCDCLEILKVL